MRDRVQCCGTCKYHEHESVDDGWVCVNEQSRYCADWTEYDDICEEYDANREKYDDICENRKSRE